MSFVHRHRRLLCLQGMWPKSYTDLCSPKTSIRLLHSEGTSGLYRNIAVMGLGASPAHAVHFAVYKLAKHRRRSPPHAASGILATTANDAVLTPILTPMDVVKQRLQQRRSPYRGVQDCVARILTEEGIGAFYAFYVPYRTNILTNAPFTPVHFSTYEVVKKILSQAGQC